MADRPEEVPDVEDLKPSSPLPINADDQRVQCIMRAALRPETVREADKLLLVDGVEHRHYCSLDDLVLQSGDTQRPLPPIRLGYVLAPAGLRPVRAPMDSRMQVPQIALQVCLVVVPRHPIHPRRRVPLEGVERQLEQIRIDVVEQRGEPFFFLTFAA